MESLSGSITLEQLKQLSNIDRARKLREILRECRRQHNNIVDCPSCVNYETEECFFNQLFNIKPKRIIPLTVKHKLTYAQHKELNINKRIEEWKQRSDKE